MSLRILYWIPHDGLQLGEVTVLRNLGHHVYYWDPTQQQPSAGDGRSQAQSGDGPSQAQSGDGYWPVEVTQCLNDFDPNQGPIPSNVLEIINMSFDLVILSMLNLTLIGQLRTVYQRGVYIRIFGYEHPNNYEHVYRWIASDPHTL